MDKNKLAEGTAIRPQMGTGFLKEVFGGKPFMGCIIELIKNARDWKAASVSIDTTLARNTFRMVDNGNGMTEENRRSFSSIHLSAANGPRQSGLFGMGSKHMFFSHSTDVTVRTAPEDDPDSVYVFSFGTGEYERIVFENGIIESERLRKNKTTWPHASRFGTEIVYTLAKPQSRAILRGAQLAEELSARLPRKFVDIVRVDGQPIPPKRIIGSSFDVVEQHTQLGEITFEIYRPAERRQEEDLLLTAVEIGEVPFSNFCRVLRDLRDMVPEVYLLPETCGTISAPFLKEHANEDRFTLNGTLADDPRTRHFLTMLRRFAPEIQTRLKIKMGSAPELNADSAIIDEVIDLFNACYNPTGAQPEGDGLFPSVIIDGGTDDGPAERQAIQLDYRREFEVGETIRVKVNFRPDLAKKYRLKDLNWITDRSRGTNFKLTDEGFELIAADIGPGALHADLAGTPHAATAHYQVVHNRVFRLSIPFAKIALGHEVPLIGINLDKLKGDIRWELRAGGVGVLEPHGGRAQYRATHEGHALIVATDSENPKCSASSDITVLPGQQHLVRICDEWFEYHAYNAEPSDAHALAAAPVTMIEGSRFHRLLVNQRGNGYQIAAQQNALRHFLALSIAQSYARFSRFEVGDRERRTIDPREISHVLAEISLEGLRIYEKILGKPPKKN